MNKHEMHLACLLDEKQIRYKCQVSGLVPDRKFVVDFLVPDIPAVIELQGGIWASGRGKHIQGAHAMPKMIERDCEKANLLQIEGYMVYKIPTGWLCGERFEKLKIVLDFLSFAQDWKKNKIGGNYEAHTKGSGIESIKIGNDSPVLGSKTTTSYNKTGSKNKRSKK